MDGVRMRLHVRGVRIAGALITLDVDVGRVTTTNLPPGLDLVGAPARG
jgi:hypothetical protein